MVAVIRRNRTSSTCPILAPPREDDLSIPESGDVRKRTQVELLGNHSDIGMAERVQVDAISAMVLMSGA